MKIRGITFTNPNFDFEWEEAKRYPELFKDKEHWLEVAQKGEAKAFREVKRNLTNVDFNVENLEKEKLDRFFRAYHKGEIEMPIVIRIDNHYELIAGNTRVAELYNKGMDDFTVWVIKNER